MVHFLTLPLPPGERNEVRGKCCEKPFCDVLKV
ncbi:hypothetical protein BMS3Abin14_00162 [bacterium BMS3Abin14]|nr:hypothetical protein BMS3Abin14_00162 [bacterium BMS3Abin14]